MTTKQDFLNFWQNAKFKTSDECILANEYDILKNNGLLITGADWEQNNQDDNVKKLHEELPAEPFDGDLENATIYIVSINPHAGSYIDEYTNNFKHHLRQNLLMDRIRKNRLQQNTSCPFYYLDKDLKETGGGIWWLSKFKYTIKKLQEDLQISYIDAIKLISNNVFDLELCPYHSAKWKELNPEEKQIISQLDSVKTALDLFKDVIIPDVINNNKKLIMLNGTRDLSKWLGTKKFNYTNNSLLTFEELYDKLSDENHDINDKDLRMICYWKKNFGYARKASMGGTTPAGKLLLNHLKDVWKKTHSTKNSQ